MASKTIADEIRSKLALGEKFEDAEFLFDTLFGLRSGSTLTTQQNATLTGALLCFLVPAKPAQYVADMHKYRLQFAGIATDPSLQQRFRASILPLALTLEEPETKNVQWDANLFFQMRAETEDEGSLTA